MDNYNFDKVAQAITNLVYRILGRPDAPVGRVYLMIFQNVNADDNNLSDIKDVRGSLITGVPRVNDNSLLFALTKGDTLLCVRGPDTPLVIVGRLVGDIRNVLT